MARDARVDHYIAIAEPFARPILMHVRGLAHAAMPDLQEDMKWSRPAFLYHGKIIVSLAAFKAHAAVVIHGDEPQGEGMGQYGKLASLSDLPPDDDLKASMKAACERVETTGSAISRPAVREPQAEIAVPGDFEAALARDAAARDGFAALAPSYRREYLEWIVDAKRDETRGKRIAQAVAQLAEGKRLNWKYDSC